MKDPFRITFAVLLWGLKICLSYIFLCWVVGDQRCRLHIWKAGFNKSRGLFLGMQRNSRHIQQSINLASIVTFSGDKRCDVLHLSHFWEECDALAHKNIYFNLWRFFLHPSRKNVTFLDPLVQKIFEREEMWWFGWDWNMFFSSRLRFVIYLGSVKRKGHLG